MLTTFPSIKYPVGDYVRSRLPRWFFCRAVTSHLTLRESAAVDVGYDLECSATRSIIPTLCLAEYQLLNASWRRLPVIPTLRRAAGSINQPTAPSVVCQRRIASLIAPASSD